MGFYPTGGLSARLANLLHPALQKVGQHGNPPTDEREPEEKTQASMPPKRGLRVSSDQHTATVCWPLATTKSPTIVEDRLQLSAAQLGAI